MSDPVPPSEATPESAGSSPSAGVFPGAPIAPADEGYRTLSVTALLGFGIGATYAAVITVLAVVGLFSGRPLHMPSYTAVIPLAAVLICLLARFQIRASEGTLAGEALARWGLGLSVFVALCYFAYVTAIYFAIRQQARTYADTWMERLREQDRARAALAMLPPLSRVNLREDDPDLQRQIVRQFQMAGEQTSTDPMLHFSRQPLVRLLLQGGKESRFEAKGVRSWEYSKGGYLVEFNYEIETPEGVFPAVVALHGTKAPHNEYPHRQWVIDFERTRLNNEEAAPRISEFGRTAQKLNQGGRQIVGAFLSGLAMPERDGSFLLTLPPSDRARALKQLKNGQRLAAVIGPVMAAQAIKGDYLQDYQRLVAGETVRIDAGALQGTPEARGTLTAKIRDLIPGSPVMRPPLELARDAVPFRTVEGAHVRLSFDFQLAMMKEQLSVNGVLDVEADAKALESPDVNPQWRIAGIRIVSGRWLKSEPGSGKPPPTPPALPGL